MAYPPYPAPTQFETRAIQAKELASRRAARRGAAKKRSRLVSWLLPGPAPAGCMQ